jgi:hypothetical protein
MTAVNTSEAVSSYNGALDEMGLAGRSVLTGQLIVRRNTGSVDYMATK